jgi:putative endonuclease
MAGFMYILTNKNNTTLYVGATRDIEFRVFQHKIKFFPRSFSARYNLNKLVYYEIFDYKEEAFERESQLKGGSRKKKIDLINSINPGWNDLYGDLMIKLKGFKRFDV